jgi:hypothetical protein
MSPLFDARYTELSLRSRHQSSLFLLAVLLPAALLVATKVRVALAATLGQSGGVRNLERALSLDPSSPELHRRLGLALFYLEKPPRLTEGLDHLRLAAELGPHQAQYWLDLATACESMSQAGCADRAFARAAELRPAAPSFQWAVANHALRAGHPDEALAGFRRLLELDPAYGPGTFRLCLRVFNDPERIFGAVLPSGGDPRLRLAYVEFLGQNGQIDLAHDFWTRAVRNASSFPLAMADPYLERLLELERGEEAQGVWRDLQRLGVVPGPPTAQDDHGSRSNLVFNGDFEQTPLGTGLDWRAPKTPYVQVDFTDPRAYHGTRCLRLDFTVSRNDEAMPAYQFVPVSPKRAYRLTAYVRSDGITSDSGPRLRVRDPACPSCLDKLSDGTAGTTPWHPVTLAFSAGPRTELVHLSVLRLRSRAFPTEITGSFWLDDVRLEPLGPAAPTEAHP